MSTYIYRDLGIFNTQKYDIGEYILYIYRDLGIFNTQKYDIGENICIQGPGHIQYTEI